MHTSFTRRLKGWMLALAACTGTAWAQQSDIDIYAGGSGVIDRPNVLFVLDSSANWNPSVGSNCFFKDNGVNNGQPTDQGSKYAVELCALYNVIDRLPTKSDGTALFNVGIMLTNANPDSAKGGYPLKAFTALDATGKAALKLAIRGIENAPSYKANLAQYSLMMHEAYLYFKGLPPRVGNLNTPRDAAAFSGGNYLSPSGNSCGRNYIILIANGAPTNGENSDAESLLRGLGGAAAVDLIDDASLGTNKANWADEYARFLRTVDVSNKIDVQGIITHGVAVVDPKDAGKAPDTRYRNFIRSMASYGGGQYYEASETDVLVTSIEKIFNQIQAVNSVFASASLPVSVNARGTYLNQVYMGMFRPDADGKPRWRGNLKQYKFGLDNLDNLLLTDSAGQPAISASTGFINPSAIAFWTAPSTFWANQQMGTPLSGSDSPDGEVVEKGSVAQSLRTVYQSDQTIRNVYTCIGCSTTAVSLGSGTAVFNNANTAITQTALAVADATSRTNLINWVRGESNAGDEAGPTTPSGIDVRPSIHGDVLHSRPAVVNYGGTTGVVVFYGSNDGQLRAVNGNQTGTGAGTELWSFVPEEHFPTLNRLRSNSPNIRLSTTVSSTATARDYFVDGPIGVYQKFSTAGVLERAWIFVGMRRGGRFIYAFDVTTPASPRFMWKVTNSSTGMSRLGQTWSEPKPARIKGQTDPVLIFGGGYDAAAEDGSASTSMGNAIYVLNASTGALLREFTSLDAAATATSIGRSVPADVTLLDTDFDGLVDRAYAVDLGGQVYRLDFESSAGTALASTAWTIYKVADLSGGTTTGRKFFYAPDAVATRDFTALMVGSGDREKPLLSATQDHFFQIFDRRVSKGAVSAATPGVFADLTAMGSISATPSVGCYMAMEQGEKVVNAATSIGGSTFFGTNRPSSSSSSNTCSANLGVAKTYAMPLFCTAATGQVVAGGGLPPSPVAGIVSVPKGEKMVQVPFVIGAPNSRNSAIEGSRLRPTIDAPRKRKYWFQETPR